MTGMLTGLYAGDDTLRIEPPRATLGQLQLTNRLELVRVENDVLGVAESLKRIDSGLVLMFDKGQGIYVLYHEGFNDRAEWVEKFIGAYKELDQRIVNLIERIDGQGRGRYDLARELDRLEEQRDRENEQRFHETIGERAEQLRHALRKDLGAEGSTVMPGHSRGIYRNRAERRAAANRSTR